MAPSQPSSLPEEQARLINDVFAQLRGGHVPAKAELDGFERLVRAIARVPEPAANAQAPAHSITGRLMNMGHTLMEKLHHAAPTAEAGPPATAPTIAAHAAAKPAVPIQAARPSVPMKPAAPATPDAAPPVPVGADGDSQLKQRQAKDANTPPEILNKLATDENSDVRLAVAHNHHTSPVLLMRMSDDDDLMVRAAVGANTQTPPKTLAKLSENPQALVRIRVAQNPRTPAEVLARLATDSEAKVRMAVAHNPSTDDYTLQSLISDADEDIGNVAQTAHNARAEAATSAPPSGGDDIIHIS